MRRYAINHLQNHTLSDNEPIEKQGAASHSNQSRSFHVLLPRLLGDSHATGRRKHTAHERQRLLDTLTMTGWFSARTVLARAYYAMHHTF